MFVRKTITLHQNCKRKKVMEKKLKLSLNMVILSEFSENTFMNVLGVISIKNSK